MNFQVTAATSASQDARPYFQGSYVINRQEAKSKLQRLLPGTEEHSKLQNALTRTTGIVEICLPKDSYKVDTASKNCALLGGFGASEHYEIGAEVNLKGLPAQKNTPLLVRGVTPIHFQQIVALAGDFYGIPGQAISLPGGTNAEKTQRFINAFNTLANADNQQISQIIMAIDGEYAKVKHSALPHHCYSQQMMEKHNEIKKVKADIQALLIDNSDHFSTNAKDAYSIGHAHAISVAREAGKQKDLEGLKRAYALDAFACHFLTDLFSAGHTRNERGELESFLINQLEFTPDQAKPLAGALTAAQHEKDGNDGLNVINKRKESWRAYGDGNFFLPKNEENKQKVIAAVQQSVNEIYDAWEKPDVRMPSIVDELIPEETPFNPLPIYSVRDNSTGGKSLYLFQGIEIKEIKTKWNYINEGLAHAANYLPEEYIFGFLKGKLPSLEIPPSIVKTFVVRVLIPGYTRLTGTVWNAVGIASYQQVKQGNLQLNAKIDEMAGVIQKTYDNTVLILREIQKVHAHLDEISWNFIIGEINKPIKIIQGVAHEHQFHTDTLEYSQRENSIQRLWDALNELSSVLSGPTVLAAYELKLLKDNTNPTSPTEVKIKVTKWLREMQEYQVVAYGLHETLRLIQYNINKPIRDSIKKQVLELEKSVIQQLELIENNINEELIKKQVLELENNLIKQLDAHKTPIYRELIKKQVLELENNIIKQLKLHNSNSDKELIKEGTLELENKLIRQLEFNEGLVFSEYTRKLISELIEKLIHQVEINSAYIDQELVCESSPYIQQLLANSEATRLAQQRFEQFTGPNVERNK